MALELYYTSSPRGLRPGASGLCTVAMTRTMSAALAARLESLCGYRPPSEGTPIEQWPVALSHWIVDVGGVERHILASVRPVKPDHTMRSNTLAHFAVLHTSELDPAGAAWMIAQPETSATTWSGEPRLLDTERAMPKGGAVGARRCVTWQSIAGDAGWAGVLANAAMLDPSKPTTVIYPAGARVLDMVVEALSLVPAAHRWRVTFTTYFTQPIAGLRCTWRFCLDGTSAAAAARQGGGLVIDACSPQPCARTGAFVDAARSGREPALSSAADTGHVHLRSAPASASAAAIEAVHGVSGEGSPRDPARRVPQRRPVGIDEPAHAESPGGRTALAAAVVVAVVLLAVVAVMAVIMRSMGSQAAELEARIEQMQQEMSALSESGTELEGLRADVKRLNEDLGSASAQRKQLEDERDSLRNQLDERDRQGQPQPPSAPRQPAPSGQDAQQPADAPLSGAESATGPSAAAMPADAVHRQPGATQSAIGTHAALAREDVIARVAAPNLDALSDQVVQLPWPAASECGATAMAFVPSVALAQCGFRAHAGSMLAFDIPGKGAVSIARLDVSGSGPTWTWLKGSVPKIQDALLSRGLKLPDDWPAILGQVKLLATCADAQTRAAVMGAPRALTWTVYGKGMGRVEADMLAALAVAPVVEWAGAGFEVSGKPDDDVLHNGHMGSIAVRLARLQSERPMLRVTLEWIPSDAEVAARRCADELTAAIANERTLNALWVNAQWISGQPDVPAGVSRPAPDALAAAKAKFDAWVGDHAKGLSTKAERDAFAAQAMQLKVTQFRAWLLESGLAPMRNALVQLKAQCDQACTEWRESVQGTVATIRPDRDSPPVAVVTLAADLKVPALPEFSETTVRGGGR